MSQDTPMKPALAKCEEAVQPPGPTGFGIGDGDICAECGSMVDTDGRDWEDGDLCWTCKAERFDTLVENVPILAAEHRAALAKLEAARKTLLNIARYTGAGPYTEDRFDAVKSSAMGTFEETKPDASPLRTFSNTQPVLGNDLKKPLVVQELVPPKGVPPILESDWAHERECICDRCTTTKSYLKGEHFPPRSKTGG